MNYRKPVLSVIVPVYNEEQYIEECVKSILRQTYTTIEIILVDDGSSDRSGFICDQLAKENSCIKVLHIENGGIIKARLAGLKVSLAEMVTFVDADDWIDDNAYKDLLPYKNYDVIITGICRYIDPEHQIMQVPYLKEGVYDKEAIMNEIVPIMLWTSRLEDWALDPSLCTKLFKKEIVLEYLERAAEVDSNYGEDSMVIFPLMLQADRIQISKKIYYYHRQRTSGEISPYIKDEEYISKLNNVYEYLKTQFKRTPYWGIMKNQLDCFYINSTDLKKCCYNYLTFKFAVHFPIEKIPKNSDVVLYGAGDLGKQYWKQNILYCFCNIKLWVDKNYDKLRGDCDNIKNPELIKDTDFDYILIAVDNYYIAKEIVFYLKKIGIEKEKIIWQSARINDKGFQDVFDGCKIESP